jgi:hypothetical protein
VPPVPFAGSGADEHADSPDDARTENISSRIHAPGRNIGITLTGTLPAPGEGAGRFRSILLATLEWQP